MSELSSIGGYTSISSVSVVYSNSGNTQSVTVSTNKGSVTITGEEFKKAFNLRAPGYIGVKSTLFNIEKL
jgi:peptidoglycan hydrolase-like amidase